MPASARPQIEPDRHWYVSAYGRALKRVVAAVLLTFVCFSVSGGAEKSWARVTGYSPFTRPHLSTGYDQTLNGLLPFRAVEPVYVQFADYVVSVVQSPVIAVIGLAGLVTLTFHLEMSLRRRHR